MGCVQEFLTQELIYSCLSDLPKGSRGLGSLFCAGRHGVLCSGNRDSKPKARVGAHDDARCGGSHFQMSGGADDLFLLLVFRVWYPMHYRHGCNIAHHAATLPYLRLFDKFRDGCNTRNLNVPIILVWSLVYSPYLPLHFPSF